MDLFGIAGGEGAKAQLLGRECADDWIKKKPPMSWFCMIFAFYEVSRHNGRHANIYTTCRLPTLEKGAFQGYNWSSIQWRTNDTKKKRGIKSSEPRKKERWR